MATASAITTYEHRPIRGRPVAESGLAGWACSNEAGHLCQLRVGAHPVARTQRRPPAFAVGPRPASPTSLRRGRSHREHRLVDRAPIPPQPCRRWRPSTGTTTNRRRPRVGDGDPALAPVVVEHRDVLRPSSSSARNAAPARRCPRLEIAPIMDQHRLPTRPPARGALRRRRATA